MKGANEGCLCATISRSRNAIPTSPRTARHRQNHPRMKRDPRTFTGWDEAESVAVGSPRASAAESGPGAGIARVVAPCVESRSNITHRDPDSGNAKEGDRTGEQQFYDHALC